MHLRFDARIEIGQFEIAALNRSALSHPEHAEDYSYNRTSYLIILITFYICFFKEMKQTYGLKRSMTPGILHFVYDDRTARDIVPMALARSDPGFFPLIHPPGFFMDSMLNVEE